MSKTPGRRLRDLLSRPGIVVSPGVYDGFSARIAHEVGFECLYMVSHGHFLLVVYVLTRVDGGRNLRVETRPTRPGFRIAARDARACRNDRQP